MTGQIRISINPKCLSGHFIIYKIPVSILRRYGDNQGFEFDDGIETSYRFLSKAGLIAKKFFEFRLSCTFRSSSPKR